MCMQYLKVNLYSKQSSQNLNSCATVQFSWIEWRYTPEVKWEELGFVFRVKLSFWRMEPEGRQRQ